MLEKTLAFLGFSGFLYSVLPLWDTFFKFIRRDCSVLCFISGSRCGLSSCCSRTRSCWCSFLTGGTAVRTWSMSPWEMQWTASASYMNKASRPLTPSSATSPTTSAISSATWIRLRTCVLLCELKNYRHLPGNLADHSGYQGK